MSSAPMSEVQDESKRQHVPDGSGRPPRWSEEVVRVDRRGVVHVRLRDGNRSLLLRLSSPGAASRVLAPGRFGDVSYTEVVGLSESDAADLGRAYAARLARRGTSLLVPFPHLAVAAAAGRLPGSCR